MSREKVMQLGLLGQSIGYSLSPFIHEYSAEKLSRKITYKLYDLKEDEVSPFIEHFLESSCNGFNVTKPYKSLVAKLIPGCSLSSVNTVYIDDGKLQGASTDAEGFVNALMHLGKKISNFSQVVILGSGGVVSALLEYIEKDERLYHIPIKVFRRSAKNDEVIKDIVNNTSVSFLPFDVDPLKGTVSNGEETLLIQATSAPLHGDGLGGLLPALEKFRGVIVDLVYGVPSELYHYAIQKKIPAQDGLPMLIEQARLSQELWWGESAGYSDISKALKLKLDI